jgi:arginine utilization protein RocB
VRDLAIALVRAPSVTESEGETAFAAHIVAMLRRMPYFAAHPENIVVRETRDDFCARSNVYALVRGHGRAAVLLAGHYDVVSVANYGPLEPLAFDPIALAPALQAALEGQLAALSSPDADASLAQAIDDLRSGDFLPGRGMLDMKGGLAIGMAVLEHFASQPERDGNLLMVFSPDEENYSYGMRSAAADLPALLSDWGLAVRLAINLDAAVNSGDGSDGRAIFTGSVSKLLPFVYLVGRPSHVGAPFDGVNATLLLAELTRELECNPAYGDPHLTHGEAPPAPVTLRAADLKTHYDVTMPEQAFVAINVLTYSDGPEPVLARMHSAAQTALDAAHALMRERAARAGAPFHIDAGRVLSYADLRAHAVRIAGAAEVDAVLAALAGDRSLDVLAICQRSAQALARLGGVGGPIAVVGLAPIYYPLAALAASQQALRAHLADSAASIARDTGYAIAQRPFFTGISDMSFLGASVDAAAVQALAHNTPAWAERWNLAPSAATAMPVVNIGPWGRDYHQRTERVHVPYSFGVVPELVWRVAMAMLQHEGVL